MEEEFYYEMSAHQDKYIEIDDIYKNESFIDLLDYDGDWE